MEVEVGKKMKNRLIGPRTMEQWLKECPVLEKIMQERETLWLNPSYDAFERASRSTPLTNTDVEEAEKRLRRFAPYIARVFPETRRQDGIIESPLVDLTRTMQQLGKSYEKRISGTYLLKCDNKLAISGSIKARGGIYEVLKYAESIAMKHGFLKENDNYIEFDSNAFRTLYSRHSLAVGSTGNLGLSIGLMGSQLGFRVFVHMSSDAKKWKKDLLRKRGVTVIEYQSDYSMAVRNGREQARTDPEMYFIDDENSSDLFLGYATAASRLADQLKDKNIQVNKENPLFVYLPCGVGGGPGGICFGLKQIFKDNVHCFFAEPTASPCMLLGLLTGLHGDISVRDFNLSNVTEADGLAVASSSTFVGQAMGGMISGVYTVTDKTLFFLLSQLAKLQNIYLEPSALAGVAGPFALQGGEAGAQ